MTSFLMYCFIKMYYVGAGICTLFISDGLVPYIFRRNMARTRLMKKEKDGKLFFPAESAFSLANIE